MSPPEPLESTAVGLLVDPQPVTIFAITYRQRDKVLQLMRDLARQEYSPTLFELVVLDDGGDDGTFDAARAESAGMPYAVTLLLRHHEADYMSAKRWNECIAAADPSSKVLVQVDDVRVRQDFLQQHLKWHSQAHTVVTGAKFEGDEETWDLAACRRAHLAGPGGEARSISAWTAAWAASLSYPRALVDAVTHEPFDLPYDERMVGWGLHEVELAYRMVVAGADLVYDPAAGVFHQNHTAASEEARAIDRAHAIGQGYRRNEQYVCTKHDLRSLPRW
jgi:glycosyltransferase involved in cell wall biosynthesis